MDTKRRAVSGALAGAGGTLVLSGLRVALNRVGLVFDTAPVQVVDRIEELGIVKDISPGTRRMMVAVAHIAYGIGSGMILGLLRRRAGGPSEEAAVGLALGVLLWGVGWSSWLPLSGVHRAPWTQSSPKVLLPILDHAAFGSAWGLVYWALTRNKR